MSTEVIQLIVQSGAVGIAFFLSWAIYKLSANHIEHDRDAKEKLTNAITELITWLKTSNKRK